MKFGGLHIVAALCIIIVAVSAGVVQSATLLRDNNNNDDGTQPKAGGEVVKKAIYRIDAQFDPAYGGVYSALQAFPLDATHTMEDAQQFPRVMFSSRHSRTFLVHGDKCKTVDDKGMMTKFCQTHSNMFKIDKDTILHEMTKDLKDKGDYVERMHLMLGGNATQWVCEEEEDKECVQQEGTNTSVPMATVQTGLMYAGVARDANFWGQGFVNRRKTDTSLADGALSLWPSAPEDTDNFGAKTPLKDLLDTKVLWKPFVSIKMDQELDGTESTHGLIKFGAYEFPECTKWHVDDSSDAPTTPWHLFLSNVKIGDDFLVENQTAVIDTTDEFIVMPKDVWDVVWRKYPDWTQSRGCDVTGDLTKMPTLEFQIGPDEKYRVRVRAQDYVRKSGNECERLWRETFNSTLFDFDEPQKWRLGLPFLRNHCVALNLEKNQVWISADRFNDPEPEPTNGAFTSAVFIAPFMLLLLALLTSTTTVVTRWL